VIAAVVFLRGQVSDKFGEAGSKLSNNGGSGQQLQVRGAWVERTDVIVGLQPTCPENQRRNPWVRT